MDRRRRVGAGQQGRIEDGRDRRREGREIGAHVGDRIDPERQELAVLVHGELGMARMVAALRVGDEGLRPVGRPFDRPLHLGGGPGDDRLLGIMVDLGAEAAADVRRHDPELMFRQMQHEGAHQQADDMRVLAGGIERVVARTAVVFADRRARLHRVGDQAVVDQVELGDQLGFGEGGVDRGLVADLPLVAGVGRRLVEQLGGSRLHRIGRFDRRRQHAVVDLDQLGRVLGLVARLGDDDRDRVADMAHLAPGQHRVRRLDHGLAMLVGDQPAAGQAADPGGRQIGAGEDRDDAGCRQRLRRVDGAQGRVGVRAPEQIGVGLARTIDVVGIVTLAGQEAEILLAADGGADAARGCGVIRHGNLPSPWPPPPPP